MSNIYDKSSLVLIPSGTKTGKVYSQKPTNGDGDFTFTRSSAATRVNADGNIEKERTNHITYSEDFTQWGLLGSATRTTGITDPNGGSTAVKVSNIGAGTGNYIDGIRLTAMPVTISAGSVVCQSIYMKGSGTILIGIERAISGSYFFNTQGFTLSSEWQRFDFFNLIATAAGGVNFYVTNTTSTTATSVDVAFAQFEFGTAPTAYIPTNGSAVTTGITDNVPRLDYTDSSCPALLLEPLRTNGITASEYFDGSNLVNTSISAEYNTNDTLSPEGVYNAAKLTAAGTFPRYYSYPSIGDNVNVTMSCFAKAGSANKFALTGYNKNSETASVFFDLLDGTAALTPYDELTPSYDIEDYGNGWYRCWMSWSSGSGAVSFGIRPFNHAQGQTGGWSGSNYIYGYGAQFEEGSYPTSYIPTYGSSVSRVADANVVITSASSIIGQQEGTFYLEIDNALNTPNAFWYNISDSSYTNWIFCGYDGHNFRFYIRTGNSVQYDSGSVGVIGANKIAFIYKSGAIAAFVNGVQVKDATTTFNVTAALNYITLGSPSPAGGDILEAYPVKQALLFQTALTDQEAIDLTTI